MIRGTSRAIVRLESRSWHLIAGGSGGRIDRVPWHWDFIQLERVLGRNMLGTLQYREFCRIVFSEPFVASISIRIWRVQAFF